MKTTITLTMNPALDVSCRTESVAPERKLGCHQISRHPGGGGINVSRALRQLEGTSTAIYPMGGPAGQLIKDCLEKEGVKQDPIEIQAWTRQNLIVQEESSGQQFRFGMPGAELTESEWRGCLDRLDSMEDVEYLIASGSLSPGVPDDFYARIARKARQREMKLILDTRGEPLRLAVQEGVFLLKPNLRELGQLAGTEIASEEHQVRVAEELLRSGGCRILALSLGAAGAMLVTDGLRERIRSPSVPIKSKVGAGDSMVAGIVFGLTQGMSPRDAVVCGVAAGAAAVMTAGTELCRKADTERLFRDLRTASADPVQGDERKGLQ